MDRRTFLSHTLIGGVATISPAWRATAAASSFPVILLVNGVTPFTNARALFSFLDPIISQNIPVGVAIRSDAATWRERQPDAELMQLFSRLAADYPGLVELALEIPDLATLQPYLRMRAVSEAQNRLGRALLATADNEVARELPRTVMATLPEGEAPLMSGVRSAGILSSFLIPPKGSITEIWRNEDGTQQINGGFRLPLSPSADDIAQAISEATSRDEPVVFAASYPDDPTLGQEALFTRGAVVGDGFRKNLSSSRNYRILPSELRIRSGAAFSRNVVLCLQGHGIGDTPDLLAEKLKAASVPFTKISGGWGASELGANIGTGDSDRPGCVLVSGDDAQKWSVARRHAFGDVLPEGDRGVLGVTTCAASGVEVTTDSSKGEHGGFDILLDMSSTKMRSVGFDEHGTLRLDATLILAEPQSAMTADQLRLKIGQTAGPNSDVVLIVDQRGFRTAEHANLLTNALTVLAGSDRFKLIDMDEYFDAVSAPSEPARLLRVARRWPARPEARDVSAPETDDLLDDARRAWSYVEQMTNPDTGLVPATAWLEGEKLETYDYCTMWDTGSLILAIISAHSIGLLTDDAFMARIGSALAGIETGSFGGLRLPMGLTSTTGKAAGDNKYNASDTARLLASLHSLELYVQRDLGIRKIVESWDLTETIKDGVPLTARGNGFVSSYRSNYASYIARSFALWDYKVRSPYTEPVFASAFDRGVHFLHDVSNFGPIGTEPHLLEAVELGASDLAHAASEALFAAQVEEYLSSGKLTCVSEGPIAREPWFIYHGYQIKDDGGEWTAEVLDPSPRFKTRGFRRAVDMLNSKAAFLWAVCRPCDYSDLLLAEVRAKAMKSSLGVSPGVFAVTGAADLEYSDINTNGVVLQAIAYRLNGSKPANEWRMKD